MSITIEDMQAYLADRYSSWGTEQAMFMKLVEEMGEVAEVMNKKSGVKYPEQGDELQEQLGAELADMVHYVVALATLNGIDLTEAIFKKDEVASKKYGHNTNLRLFLDKIK